MAQILEMSNVTDAKALYDLLDRRSGNAGQCRRAQIDVAVICVSAKALKLTTYWCLVVQCWLTP
jgi:hypothetical protein